MLISSIVPKRQKNSTGTSFVPRYAIEKQLITHKSITTHDTRKI